MPPTPTVLVAGNVTCDRYGGGLLAGGSAYYSSHTFRALGAETRVATGAGPEFPDGSLAGLDVHVQAAPRTTVFVNEYEDGMRSGQRVEAVAPPLDPERLPAAWRAADVLHLAPILGEIDLAAWSAAIRARLVAIGVQGWVRGVGPDGRVVHPRWEADAGVLRAVHVACVGEEDLRGQGDLLDRLVAVVPIVAFTHGRHGCDVIVRGRATHVPAFTATEVDPTGAGDTFAAGFLLGLARGDAPAEAARLGAAAASVIVEARAGEALARMPEALARANRVGAGPHAGGRRAG